MEVEAEGRGGGGERSDKTGFFFLNCRSNHIMTNGMRV